MFCLNGLIIKNMKGDLNFNMKIRKATEKDLKEIAKIFRAESGKKPYNQKWSEKESLKKIRTIFELGSIYLYIADKKILGFISIMGEGKKEAYIDEFYVDSKSQGKGVGSKLLNFAEEECIKKKIKKITVMANQKAKAFQFYQKFKYKPNYEDIFMNKELK